MARIEHAMEINAPVHVVYDQLLRFEEYPRFLNGVQAVRRLEDGQLRWHARAGDQNIEWDAEITQQVPGQYIAWQKSGAPRHEGRIMLQADGEQRTRLHLSIEHDAQADGASFGAMLARRVEQDLVRFKKCVESAGSTSSAWPGTPMPGQEAQSLDGGAVPARPAAAGIAYRRRREASERPPGLDMRPPWLPVFLQVWENPLRIMRRVSQGMDKLMDGVIASARLDAHHAATHANDAYRVGTAWSPLLEVTRSDDSVVVLAELAGVRREDVQIDIRADRLMIEGDRHPQQPGQPGGSQRSERSYGHFYRVVDLPLGADPDAATASMHDGLLEIRVPVRPGAAQRRRLDIQSSE
ncbi:Hsp20 family protein [Noviherbaspirillum aerium]|uniref:Hsp20 family protein n=1 Tax=Noviherbaspirillum aerium TaxID=2588497 RepID=UPI00178C376A|nr:Hsp20 family protein [Noviherbaspirillum aerium]